MDVTQVAIKTCGSSITISSQGKTRRKIKWRCSNKIKRGQLYGQLYNVPHVMLVPSGVHIALGPWPVLTRKSPDPDSVCVRAMYYITHCLSADTKSPSAPLNNSRSTILGLHPAGNLVEFPDYWLHPKK